MPIIVRIRISRILGLARFQIMLPLRILPILESRKS